MYKKCSVIHANYGERATSRVRRNLVTSYVRSIAALVRYCNKLHVL